MGNKGSIPRKIRAVEDRNGEQQVRQCHQWQEELELLNDAEYMEVKAIQDKFKKLRKPCYWQRAAVIERIPKFWVNAIVSHPRIGRLVTQEEKDCLHFLKKLEVEELANGESGFLLKFIFDENPFFDNEELIKKLQFGPIGETRSSSTLIKWKESMELPKKEPEIFDGRKRRCEEKEMTFFSWFVDNKDRATHDISEVFKDDLWRNPLHYYFISREASLLNGENKVDETTTSVFDLLPETWEDGIWPSLSPKDFESLNDADLRFRTLIEPVKDEKLFPLVLPIVLKNCGMDKPSDLLIWRSVNKVAKSIVDDLLEESSSSENYQWESGIDSPLWTPVLGSAEEDLRLVIQKIKCCYRFSTLSRLQRFVEHMNSAPGVTLANPFLTKSLALDKRLDNELVANDPAYRLPNELLLAMLQRYGHLIRSLFFRDADYLFSLLRLLPNLRILVLSGRYAMFSEDDILRWVAPVRLDQLEVLDVVGCYKIGEPVFHPLLSRVGTQLRTLVCFADIGFPAGVLETLRQDRFPNLRTIRVAGGQPAFTTEFLTDVPSPLQEIAIIPWNWDDDISNEASFAKVNRHIGRFASTLTRLKFYDSLGADEDGDNDVDNLLSYPKLSALTINYLSISKEWFGKFIQLKSPLLAELNVTLDPEETTVSEILAMLQEQQVFEKASTLQRVNILTGFTMQLDPHEAEKAEKVVIERKGSVTTILYEKILEDKPIHA